MDDAMSEANAATSGGRRRVLRFLLKSPAAAIGVIVILLYLLAAVLAPLLSPYEPTAVHLRDRMMPPVWASEANDRFILGTDHLGRDLLSRLLHGSRVALIVSFGSVLVSALIGVALGLLSGYLGGWIDGVVMRFVDMLLAVPNVLLYLTVVVIFGPSVALMIVVIGLVNWTTFARVVRSQTLAVKERQFVEAAVALGESRPRIIVRHVLPNVGSSIAVIATLDVASVIILEASLSFLGLGVQAPTVTWGRMLADGREYLATAWWLATFPGLAITFLVLALIFVGDWLRDVADPRT